MSSMIPPERFAQLTESQKTCLRLVGRGRQSKDIALELGLSPNTVDTYLRSAMRTLGVGRRSEAARLLADFEAAVSQELVSQSGDLAQPTSPDTIPYQPPSAFSDEMRVREVAVPFAAGKAPTSRGSRQGETSNARSPLQTIAWIIAIAAGLVLLTLAAPQLGAGFQALSNAMQPYHTIR